MSDFSILPPMGARPDDSSPEPAEVRLPLRFVWQSDESGRISDVSAELTAAMGPHSINGRSWDDLIQSHRMDPAGVLTQALARRDTWSGVIVDWPLARGLYSVELAGLPVYDRDRSFRGFRGFGVVRDEPPTLASADEELADTPRTSSESDQTAASPVLPFRLPDRPGLKPHEHLAFREIARALNARQSGQTFEPPVLVETDFSGQERDNALEALEGLPSAVLIHRLGVPLFANYAFLDMAGLEDLPAVTRHGLNALFDELPRHSGIRSLSLRTPGGHTLRVEAHLKTIRWNGRAASLMLLNPSAAPAAAAVPAAPEGSAFRAVLDQAADGVVTLDGEARIRSANAGAERLFGYSAAEMVGRSFTLLLGSDHHRMALESVEAQKGGGPTEARRSEVVGMTRSGTPLPLLLTLAALGEGSSAQIFAVLHDISPFKKAEEELKAAKQKAELASAHKSEVLARISHEIRTPLNAILGFAEVMAEERFGPLGAERYRQYVDDIHQSGSHIISLVNDLLDLAKIESGRLELNFARVNLNEVVTSAVALLQPQANNGRIIIRTALTPRMPPVVGDLRSLKQIVLNLVSNAVRFTPAGGQIIVSTVLTDGGSAVLRVRDTGPGMTEPEIALALEPFGQVSATNAGGGGTGLGLPLTKALVEANRAEFLIQSEPGKGTLCEVAFPPSRVLGQ